MTIDGTLDVVAAATGADLAGGQTQAGVLAAAAAGTIAAATGRRSTAVLWCPGTRPPGAPALDQDTADAEGLAAFGGAFDTTDYTVTGLVYPATAWPVTGRDTPTFGSSLASGVDALVDLVKTTEPPILLAGIEQGAMVVSHALRLLSDDPDAPDPDQLSFVVAGDGTRPGGLFWQCFTFGQTVPILDYVALPFPDTQYDGTVIVQQYDAMGDFPADWTDPTAFANATAGYLFAHNVIADYLPAPITPGYQVLPTEPTYPVLNTTVCPAHGGTITTFLLPTWPLPLLNLFPLNARDIGSLLIRAQVDAAYDRAALSYLPPIMQVYGVTAGITLRAATADITGYVAVRVWGEAYAPALTPATAALAGTLVYTGTLDATGAPATFHATSEILGVVAAETPTPTAALAGTLVYTGTLDATGTPPVAALAGMLIETGTLNAAAAKTIALLTGETYIPASYSDDFNRADNTDTLGANWTNRVNNMGIKSNQAIPKALSLWCAATWINPMASDYHYVEATCRVYTLHADLALYVGSGTDKQIYAQINSAGQARIYAGRTDWVSGGSGVANAYPSIADGDIFRFQRKGSAFRLYQNGNLLLSWNDSDGIMPQDSSHRLVGVGGMVSSAHAGEQTDCWDNWSARDTLIFGGGLNGALQAAVASLAGVMQPSGTLAATTEAATAAFESITKGTLAATTRKAAAALTGTQTQTGTAATTTQKAIAAMSGTVVSGAHYTDNFDRADSTTTLGTNWTERLTYKMGIKSNEAYCATSGQCGAATWVDPMLTDYSTTAATINTPTSSPFLLYLGTGTDKQCMAAIYSNKVSIWTATAWDPSVAGSSKRAETLSLTIVTGDVISFERASGHLFVVKQNGTTRCSWNDTGGYMPIDSSHRLAGIGGYGTGTNTPRWNDWSADDF